MYRCGRYASPLGEMVIAADEKGICGVWFADQKYFGGSIKNELQFGDEIENIRLCRAWLDRYFAGKQPSPKELRLSPHGSSFRQKVWEILLEIPYGEVVTYGDIACRLEEQEGRRMSAQAVGGAVGHNPVSIVIPCHRVVGRNGSLTGYAGGVERKEKLLQLEKCNMEGMYIPKKGTAI